MIAVEAAVWRLVFGPTAAAETCGGVVAGLLVPDALLAAKSFQVVYRSRSPVNASLLRRLELARDG